MKNNDELVDKFWANLRRADMDQSKLGFGLETRVLANLRASRKSASLSLLQLAGRLCFVSLCALLLLGVYLPMEVEAFEFNHFAETLAGANDDVATIFTLNGGSQ